MDDSLRSQVLEGGVIHYRYSLLIPCCSENDFLPVRIYNKESRYNLDGIIEIRMFQVDDDRYFKKSFIHCSNHFDDPETLSYFPRNILPSIYAPHGTIATNNPKYCI